MPYTPKHQDICVTLNKYETEKLALNPSAASNAYSSIIDELSHRGWFEIFSDSLPLEVRNFFYILFANNEINNGGFDSYFYNGYGKYASDTVKAFKEIGAPKKSALLEKVMKSFPIGKYPKSIEECEQLGLLGYLYQKIFKFLNGDFDTKYYKLDENIDELVVAYVKKHYSKFAP